MDKPFIHEIFSIRPPKKNMTIFFGVLKIFMDKSQVQIKKLIYQNIGLNLGSITDIDSKNRNETISKTFRLYILDSCLVSVYWDIVNRIQTQKILKLSDTLYFKHFIKLEKALSNNRFKEDFNFAEFITNDDRKSFGKNKIYILIVKKNDTSIDCFKYLNDKLSINKSNSKRRYGLFRLLRINRLAGRAIRELDIKNIQSFGG